MNHQFTIQLIGDKLTHNKYDDTCCMCAPPKVMVRRLACVDYQVTKCTLSGFGMQRDGFVCDDCLAEMSNDDQFRIIPANSV